MTPDINHDNRRPITMTEVQGIQVTSSQAETIQLLTGMMDRIKIAKDDLDGGAVVFEGDGQDGPCIGYVETTGVVTWIVQG